MYSALQDIQDRIPDETIIQCLDDENLQPVEIDAEDPNCERIIERAEANIKAADEIINAYCGGKYKVPFTTVPELIKNLSADIAVRKIYGHRVELMPEERKDAYDEAIALLKDIAKGTASLGVDPEPAASSSGGVHTNKEENDRIFTRDKLEDY